MSGGRFNYAQCNLGYKMYPNLDLSYGECGFLQSKLARKINPMEDRELSELVWDVLVMIYSLDWYRSGDISEEDYKKDVARFKKKWLKRKPEDQLENYKKDLKEFYDELIMELEEGYDTKT